MINQHFAIRQLQLDLLPEDQELGRLISGIFYNSFAIFVVKVIRAAECADLRQWSTTLESFVSGYIQNDAAILDRLGDRDVIWDIYLVFLVEGPIPVEVKVELENDRFYCKKIILPYHPGQTLEEQLYQMIIFQQFTDVALRESDYLGKGEFLSKLLQNVEDEALRTFVQKNDLLTLEKPQLLARFKKAFKISAGDQHVQD